MGFLLGYNCYSFVKLACEYYVGDGHVDYIPISFLQFALIKLGYCLLREEGIIKPLFLRRVYIPLAIREHEVAAGQNRALPAG